MPIDEAVLVDASAIIAIINSRLPEHTACVEVSDNLPVGKSYTCWPVVTEAAYLLRKDHRDVEKFLSSLYRDWLSLLQLTTDDIPGIQAVAEKYHDQEVDLADAAIVHLANREDIKAVFTLDRRHFRLFTRSDGTPFRLFLDDFDADK